jgi:hypothetical protein
MTGAPKVQKQSQLDVYHFDTFQRLPKAAAVTAGTSMAAIVMSAMVGCQHRLGSDFFGFLDMI